MVINTFKDGKRFWGINTDENMTIDAIIGNPPYQVMDGGNAASALPVYQHFVGLAKKLSPRYISMITPSRWFAGGRGLDTYRDEMLSDDRMEKLVDFADSQECFPTVIISGGISYFLWNKAHVGDCCIENKSHGLSNQLSRSLCEYPVFVRSNYAISIIRKIKEKSEKSLSQEVLPSNPFGFRTYIRGEKHPFSGSLRFIHSEGVGYVAKSEVEKSIDAIDTYNVITTRAMSGGNKPGADGTYQVIPTTMRVMEAGEICAETYICIGKFTTKEEANNLKSYLSTKFVRFLMLQAMTSIMISKDSFRFVPCQDFLQPQSDTVLFQKYGLSNEEIQYIDSLIKTIHY